MFKLLKVLFTLLMLVVLVILARTYLLGSVPTRTKPLAVIPVDMQVATQNLSRALQYQTVATADSDSGLSAIAGLHGHLLESYPALHRVMKRDIINGYSLLYTWQGIRTDLNPILLLAHMDVVPAENTAAENWSHPPFSGTISDGFIWGRGALDMKQSLMGIMEALEYFALQGMQPERTIIVALGHDEESGGHEGAARIAQHLREQGIKAAFSLDEGMPITHDMIPGLESPAALIGIAEKGNVTLELGTVSEGGHSSMPPKSTAAGRMARAVTRLEANPMPASLRAPTADMLVALAPGMPFLQRMLMDNMCLSEPLILTLLEKSPTTNATIRTTTAVTVFNSGKTQNVLPRQARALVNFRILPGDTVDNVIKHVRLTLNDPEIEIQLAEDSPFTQPSAIADIHSEAYSVLHKTIGETFPDVLIAPGLVVAATDSGHYADIAENSFRFIPMRLGPDDTSRIHGIDERISIENYTEIIQFYLRLLANYAFSNKAQDAIIN